MSVVIDGTLGITSPAETVQGALTTTGNTILGDASTDTLNVGNGGLVKDASGNVGIGTTVNNVYDQVASARPLVVQKSDTNTTLNGSLANITIVNSDTTTNNTAQLNFAAITGASTNQYSSASISTIFGARTNTVYPSGILTFSTSAATQAPAERMRIDSSGNVGIGLTPSAWTDSIGVIQGTAGTYAISANGTNNNQFDLLSNAYRNGGTNTYLYFGNSTATRYQQVSGAHVWYTAVSGTTGGTITFLEKMRIDTTGNTYVEAGNLWQYSPAPTALAAGANAGTAAQLLGGMFSSAQTTAVTLTMPTGTAIDTGFAGVPAVDIGFYFYVINTGSALGAVTVAVNTNVTSLGSLVVAIGTSAQFRLRRTAANTYIMYRLS